nr:family 20 glycosylhydrolase [Clostridia bacterium]
MEKLWTCMLQLGMHMWNQHACNDELECDKSMWNEITEKLAESGCNALLIDIGEGMIYDSHPELAIKGSWTKDEMRAEIERLRGMGFELIPKLNFSTAHDMWLGEYAKMLCTDTYYKVVADLIAEVCDLFKPKYFHIGMDEENFEIEKNYPLIRIRNSELWWHDLYFYVDCVEKGGARPMMWSDYARHHLDEFAEKCPKSMVQNVWYYYTVFDNMEEEKYRIRLLPYMKCEECGFDQIPTGTNVWDTTRENLRLLTEYCVERISDKHLFGIMQTPWVATQEKNRDKLYESAETLKEAREAWEKLRDEGKILK